MASDFARYVANLRQSLLDEQILDQHFLGLEDFDTANPGFLERVYTDYFRSGARFLGSMAPQLQGAPYNIPIIEDLLNGFSFCSVRLGAAKVAYQVNMMRFHLKCGGFQEFGVAYFEGIKREFKHLQSRMMNYLKTRKQPPPDEIEDRPEYGYMDSDSE